QNSAMNFFAASSVETAFHCAISSFVISTAAGPLPNAACSGVSAEALTATAAAAAARTMLRMFIRSPVRASRERKRSLLLEIFHLVVEAVHLGVDLFLLENAFADEKRGEAVQQDAVLDNHLLDLFVFIFKVAVGAFDIVHGLLSLGERCITGKQKAESRRQKAKTVALTGIGGVLSAFCFLLSAFNTIRRDETNSSCLCLVCSFLLSAAGDRGS